MKKALSYIAAIALGASSILSSCTGDYEQPPIYSPVSDLEANTTIADLKAAYWQDADGYAAIVGNLNTVTGKMLDGSKHIVVKGRVTTSDQPGNIYQTIVIEDETAAITVSTSATKLYQKYAMGQEALIDVTGLAIGKYRGLMQLGASNATGSETSRMTEAALTEHMQANGTPDSKAITPTVVTIDELMAAKSTPEGLMKWQSRLVTLENVSFQEAGMPYADGTSNTNRYIVNENRQRLLMRNSGRCDFAADLMPAGKGSVTAILSYYNTDWQLLLVSPVFLAGFEPAEPAGPLPDPNTTIAELKSAYWSTDRNYVKTVGMFDQTTPTVIEGIVVSSDRSGNIYKNLVLRDNTGALTVAVNSSSISTTFAYGQKVRLNVTDLKLGGYNGLMQLGGEGEYNGAPSMTFMELGEFRQHAELQGDPDPKAVVPVVATIPELIAAKATPEGLQKWQSQLVTIKGIHFQDAGQPFVSGNQNTNRNFSDAGGNTLFIRTSSYATFKDELLPVGTGDITAILSYYGTDWQLMLLNADGCTNFDGVPVGPVNPPTPPATGSTIFEETFKSDQGAFTIDNVNLQDPLTYVWSHDSYGYMKASAYKSGTSYPSEAWLISPEIDLAGASAVKLSFSHCVNKFPDLAFAKKSCTLHVRTSGSTPWTEVEIPTYSDNSSWSFVDDVVVDLSAFDGKKIQLGFKYTSEDGKSGTWEVKNVKVTGNK